MIGHRLQEAQRISEKRWDYYHGDVQRMNESALRGWNPTYPPKGAYKKSTGCMCATCSFYHQYSKHKTRKAVRRFTDVIPAGSFYKRLGE